MKRVAVILVCVGLVIASVGSVSAQGSHALLIPLAARAARIIASDPNIERLIVADAVVFGADPEMGVSTPIATFTLDCADPESLASAGNALRDPVGAYGSPDSPLSAMNPAAVNPPIIAEYIGGEWEAVAWCSLNASLSPRLDTAHVLSYMAARAECD